MTNTILARAFPEVAAGGFTRIDGTVLFYTRINALIDPAMTLLDFGAGRGSGTEDRVAYRRSLRVFKGKVARVIGADVDPVAHSNPSLDECVMIDQSGHIPVPDSTVNLILADHVLEHIPQPSVTASELNRVLRPGGWICIRTPNRHGYIAFVNRVAGKGLQKRIVSVMQPNRKAEDVFEAFYRMNTKSAIERCFPGYKTCIYTWDSEPGYYAGNSVVFFIMNALRVITPPPFRASLVAFLQKP